MRKARSFGRQANACNDNGVPALLFPAAAPRDVLTAARRSCGVVALSYVAGGCLLVTAAARPSAAKAA